MTSPQKPITIKKYANRRLYNTGTSTYVTLEDLAAMVKKGEDFAVFDAKSNEDITRSVLAQIIFEQEAKDGQSLLPAAFLRQLIGFYGDSMQGLVPSFLELSMGRFAGEQQNFRDHVAKAFGAPAFPPPPFTSMDELARQNMALFSNAMAMFNPFAQIQNAQKADSAPAPNAAPAPASTDFDAMQQQLNAMQKRLEEMAKKR
jgi:polyhydroxyalkanoate synthesis repressor PhaR